MTETILQENQETEDLVPLKAPFALTLVVILIGGFMSMLDSSIVNVAISPMMTAFGVNADEIDWVLTIYMLVLGIVVPTSNWLGEYFGLKKLYLLSLVVFTIGSLFCSLAWNVPSLTVARAIQALGGGIIMPVTMSMIYKITPRKNIGKAMGGYGMVFVVAPAIGPSVGGYLVQYVDWRWIFTMNLPIGIVGILLGIFIIPAMEGSDPGKFDSIGALFSAAAMFSILFLLSNGSDWGWTSLPSVMLLYAALVFLTAFIWWELRHPYPLLDIRIFKNMNYTVGNLQYQGTAKLVDDQTTRTDITSHGQGIVTELNLKVGDMLNVGSPVATVVDISSVVVTAKVPENWVGTLTEGDTVSVLVKSLGESVKGTITYISPVASSSGQLFPVKIEIDNTAGSLKPGMTCSIDFK